MRIADREVLGTSIAAHIGGRWAISLIAYAINIPINLLGSLSNITDARDAPWVTWFLIWLAGYAALGAVLLIANYTLFRSRRVQPVPVWWVVVLGALAGGTRGLVVGVLANELQISGGNSGLILTRVVTGSLLGAIMIPLAALLLSAIDSYSRQRRLLLSEIVELEQQRMQSEGESQRLRDVLVADIESNAAAIASDSDARSAREISHRLWRESSEPAEVKHAGIGWRSVMRDVFTNYPYPGAVIAAVWAVSAVGALFTALGPLRGTLQIVFSVAGILGFFTIASRLRFAAAPARVILFIAVLLVIDILTGPIASALFDPRPAQAGVGQVIANSIWIPVLSVIVGAVVLALRSSEQVLGRLARDVRAEEVAAIAATQERGRIQREVAEALHGIQSRIFATRASGATQVTLADLLAPVSAEDAREQLDRVLGTWGMLMVLEAETELDDLDEFEISAVHRVISEGLTNAYRHGEATRCQVHVSAQADYVTIRISDNGSGLTKSLASGLGSSIFDSICHGHWTLKSNADTGCELTAQVARAPQ